MTKEEAERRAQQEARSSEVDAHNILHHRHVPGTPSMDGNVEIPPHSPRDDMEVEKTLDEAQKSTDKQTSEKGRRRSEEEKPDRTLLTYTNEPRASETRGSMTLPVVQEARENSSDRGSQKEEPSDHNDQQRHQAPNPTRVQNHESEHMVEYTVTGDDRGNNGLKDFIIAPLDAQDRSETDKQGEDSRRVSKPPRIGSGIIPTLSPLYGDDEIGVAR